MIARNTSLRHRVAHNPIAAFNETGDLFMELFYNSRTSFVGLVSLEDAEIHFADGTKAEIPQFKASQHELQFRINPRWCSVPAIGSVKASADCLRNFAAELVKAADELEAMAEQSLDIEERRAAKNGKAVSE